jgi:rfaE bifunctional protein nucleotidyltransferase chain/domain
MADPPSKIQTPQALAQIAAQFAQEGRKLVFTNGCFDLLHAGHVRYLRQARQCGDALLVALNSDQSVRTLKGPSRPVNPQNDRAEVLAALEMVDYVTIFHDTRVTHLLQTIRPQIYAKGGDYTLDTLDPDERQTLDTLGIQIRLLGHLPGRSTTQILRRSNNQ